jgi:predicted phage tail protein
VRELRQIRNDGSTQIGIGETIPENEVVIRGKVDDPNETDMVRFEVELRGMSNPFTGSATQISDFVTGGTTTSIRASGLQAGTGFHWQARACDRTGRCSAWVQFGNNAESDADFSVAAPPGGNPPRRQQEGDQP